MVTPESLVGVMVSMLARKGKRYGFEDNALGTIFPIFIALPYPTVHYFVTVWGGVESVG